MQTEELGPLLNEATVEQIFKHIDNLFEDFVFSGVRRCQKWTDPEIWSHGAEYRLDGLTKGLLRYLDEEHDGEYIDLINDEDDEDGEEAYEA